MGRQEVSEWVPGMRPKDAEIGVKRQQKWDKKGGENGMDKRRRRGWRMAKMGRWDGALGMKKWGKGFRFSLIFCTFAPAIRD